MDDCSNSHIYSSNLKESVFSSFINSGKKCLHSICSDRGTSVWNAFLERFTEKGEKNTNVKKQGESISDKVSDDVHPGTKNSREGVCKWELTCCEIKMQDPCGPCCCEMYINQHDKCPHGLLPRKKHPSRGCGLHGSYAPHQQGGCCNRCRVQLDKA